MSLNCEGRILENKYVQLFSGRCGTVQSRNFSNRSRIEKSCLVTYTEGVFEIILGTPSENFHLPFKEYAEKMYEKLGDIEGFEGLVPIEN